MMYRILYNKQEIYGPELDQAVLSPTLELELNAAGRLEFTLPVTRSSTTDDDGNPIWPDDIWNNIQVFKGEVEVYEGDDCIFFGRPLQITRDWNNQKKVICEGALAYFNDTIQETREYKQKKTPLYNDENYPQGSTYNKGFFNKIIEIHNEQLKKDNNYDLSKYIEIGTVNVENSLVWRKTDGESTASVLQSMCLDTNGGYFILRKEWKEEWDSYINKIDWVKSAPMGTDQTIQFGLNLLDISQDLNGSDICTVLYPTGDNDLTVKKATTHTWEHPYVIHHAGEDHRPDTHIVHEESSNYIIHVEGYNKYGRVVKQKNFDVDGEEDNVANANALYRKAREWLDDQNWEETTIECSAADLHYVYDQTEYYSEDDDPPQKLRLGQTVEVVDAVHGVTRSLPIYKCSMSLDSGVKKITMGTPPKKELTDIVKPSTSTATRNSTGGNPSSGGSGEGGGGGGSSSAPVTDVLMKEPGSDEYGSVVKNKKAKIDLSEYVTDVLVGERSVKDNEGHAILDPNDFGKVDDVRVDGTSVVSNKIADISIPVKDVLANGTSVVDQLGRAILPVKDVRVDSASVVDNTGTANITTPVQKVQDVIFNGNSVVNSNHEARFGAVTDVLMDGQSIVLYNTAHITSDMFRPTANANQGFIIDNNKFGFSHRFLADLFLNKKSLKGFTSLLPHGTDDYVNINLVGGKNTKIHVGHPYMDDTYLPVGYNKNGSSVNITIDTISPTDPTVTNLYYDISLHTLEYGYDIVTYTIESGGLYGVIMLVVDSVSSGGRNNCEVLIYDSNDILITSMLIDRSTFNGTCAAFFKLVELSAGDYIRFIWSRDDNIEEGNVLRNVFKLSNINPSNISILYEDPLAYRTNRNSQYYSFSNKLIFGIQSVLNVPTEGVTTSTGVNLKTDYVDSDYSPINTIYSEAVYSDGDGEDFSGLYVNDGVLYTINNEYKGDTNKLTYSVYNLERDPYPQKYISCAFFIAFNSIVPQQGTIVIPNPGFASTDELTKIQIQDTVYDVVSPTELSTVVSTLESNFQDGVDAIYDACVAKGSTPASQSLSDVIQGIMDIPQGGGSGDTVSYSSSAQETSLNVELVATTWTVTNMSFSSEVIV